MEQSKNEVNYDKQFKDLCDSKYNGLVKDYYATLAERDNMKKTIEIKYNEAKKCADALCVGEVSGGLIVSNNFKKELLKKFEYNLRVCDTNPIAETLNDMVLIKEKYLKNIEKEEYEPEFVFNASYKDYINVIAEYNACQRFMELLMPFRDGFDYTSTIKKLCKKKIIDENFAVSLKSLLESPEKTEKIPIRLAIYELYILIDMLIQYGSLPSFKRENIIDADKRRKLVYKFICEHFIFKNKNSKEYSFISNEILSKNLSDSCKALSNYKKEDNISKYSLFQKRIKDSFPAVNLYIKTHLDDIKKNDDIDIEDFEII